MGGGFIEWKGYTPPKKHPPTYPFSTMKELRQHAEKNNLTIAQVILANETSIAGGARKRCMPSLTRSQTRWSPP